MKSGLAMTGERMTRWSKWIPVFSGMTWKVHSGPDSSAGQAFRRNDEVGIYTAMTGESR